MAQRMKGKITSKTVAHKDETRPAPPSDGGGTGRLDLDFVRGLAEIVSSEGLSELKIRTADAVIIVRRGGVAAAATATHAVLAPATSAHGLHPATHTVSAHPVPPPPFAAAASHTLASTPPPAAPPAAAASEPPAKKTINVTSPFVGTFYSSPSPEAPPFAEVGQRVKKGQILCIVEAMKLMNEIEAEVDGTIVEALVENAQPVEYGQVLYKLAP
jgi:acetyl-CoA carboxylase biotin carboxyl carrier protein